MNNNSNNNDSSALNSVNLGQAVVSWWCSINVPLRRADDIVICNYILCTLLRYINLLTPTYLLTAMLVASAPFAFITKLEMWANAQRDGRPAEHRWRPLFNAAKFGWRPLLDVVQ